jgi:hypothetical protein
MTRHLCLVPRILDRWIRQTDSKNFGPKRAPAVADEMNDWRICIAGLGARHPGLINYGTALSRS